MDQRHRATSPHEGVYAKPGAPRAVSAVNYYFLAVFASAAIFFIVWAVLHDGYDDAPLVVAGISALFCGGSFVFVREVLMRRSRKRAIAARKLSQQLRLVGNNLRPEEREGKLTLKKNDELLAEIRTKSEAARVLVKFADAHKEVFDLCEDYLKKAAAELSMAHPTSPRVPALRKGTVSANKRHRYHLLKWAEIKAKAFTAEVGTADSLDAKIAAGEDALAAVDQAYQVYPDELTLLDSQEVLRAFLTSAKVKRSVRQAEISVQDLDDDRAVMHYEDALASLERYNVDFEERTVIFEKIRTEISRIKQAR